MISVTVFFKNWEKFGLCMFGCPLGLVWVIMICIGKIMYVNGFNRLCLENDGHW